VITLPSDLGGTVSVWSYNFTLYLSGINITDPDARSGFLTMTVTTSTNGITTTTTPKPG